MDINEALRRVRSLPKDLGSSICSNAWKVAKALAARITELESAQKSRPMSEAPKDKPVRVWVTTSDGSAAWFDARYVAGIWRETRIEHLNHGFEERIGKVLRPSLFLPASPLPDQPKEGD